MQGDRPPAGLAISEPILVTGGTGTLGRLVVARLRCAGQAVRVLTRSPREDTDGVGYVTADLSTGTGVQDAVRGARTVVHCAGSAKGDQDKAAFLVRAASAAGVRHIVFISVVGADRVPIRGRLDQAMFGYFGAKLRAEQVIASSGIPFSTLRTTQFYDLVLTTVRAMARMPLVVAPAGTRFQPVDAEEVAARLVELALGEPAGLVPDLGGPTTYSTTELIRGYLHAAGKRRPVVSLRMPGKAAAAVRDGANLAPRAATGRRTWEEFLAERVSR